MLKQQSRIRMLERGVINGYRTGVSLHCHTQHSKEVLDFIPYYASRIPIVAGRFKKVMKDYRQQNGRDIDFTRAYWTPPLSARKVYDLEKEQIENTLDAGALISITDHDSIESGSLLHALENYKKIPVSVEWTVPFGDAYVHLGVHNLPAEYSAKIMSELAEFTTQPIEERLAELLEMLNEIPSVLIVFNHPLWDIELMGQERHMIMVKDFLVQHGRQIHALEVNGFRSSQENLGTIKLAEIWGYPIVSGGDRHGCVANTTLNVTNATSFDEFVSEIRTDKHSEVLLMPQYKENLYLRMFEAADDILRHYPQHPLGRQYWTERIFIRHQDGTEQPLKTLWQNGTPSWIQAPLAMMRVMGSRRFRPAMRLMFTRQEGVAL
jgi:hypothetical protein